jgi:GTPase Era involved in 16S rRNA processing
MNKIMLKTVLLAAVGANLSLFSMNKSKENQDRSQSPTQKIRNLHGNVFLGYLKEGSLTEEKKAHLAEIQNAYKLCLENKENSIKAEREGQEAKLLENINSLLKAFEEKFSAVDLSGLTDLEKEISKNFKSLSSGKK